MRGCPAASGCIKYSKVALVTSSAVDDPRTLRAGVAKRATPGLKPDPIMMDKDGNLVLDKLDKGGKVTFKKFRIWCGLYPALT